MTSILCPQNFIPSYISTSYQQIEISIKSAPAQLQKLYRQKNTCDIILKFAGLQIPSHKAVVDKSSAIFMQKPWPKLGDKWLIELNIKSKIERQLSQRIINCMYGYCVTIKRSEIQQAYLLAKALQLTELITIFNNDMLTHFDDYELFPLLKMATSEQIHEVIELCYDQLEIEMYEPLRYSKSGLFLCDEELFMAIVKRHNWQKSSNQKFGLSKHQVRSLIDEYCFVNGLNPQKKQKITNEIEDKQNLKYYISLNQVNCKVLTPRKVKSSSEIFFRNTLTLPRDKQNDKNFIYGKQKNRRLSPFIKGSYEHQLPYNNILNPCTLTPGQSKSDKSEHSKSISNYSTENRSIQNRSRKQSTGSIETLSDPRVLITINDIFQTQQEIQHSQTDIKSRTEQLAKKLKEQLIKAKFNRQKAYKMQSNLEQLKAEISSSRLKLTELTQTVNNVQLNKNKKQTVDKFNSLFGKDVALDLTLSTSFGIKNRQNQTKLKK